MALAIPHTANEAPPVPTAGIVEPKCDQGEVDVASIAPRSGDRSAATDPYRNLLVLRFALLNLVAVALLGVAWVNGYIAQALAADQSHLCVVIFIVFLGGWGMSAVKVWQTGRDLNSVRVREAHEGSPAARYLQPLLGRDAESRANLTGALRMQLSHRIVVVRHVANSLVLLGLIGTVVGFIIALSGVDPEQVSDVKSVAPMVSTLIKGMSTALYTTLVGAILNIWLMANHQLLASGTVKLIGSLVEMSEDHARA